MKKAFLIFTAIATIGAAHAQGLITFQYFGGGTGETPIMGPAEVLDSRWTVGLYTASDLTTPLATTTIFQSTGLFQYNGPDIVVPGAPPGSPANLVIRVWPTSEGSYAAAPSYSKGEQAFTTLPLGGVNPNPPPPALTAPDLSGPGPLGFSGMVLPVPEPSTYALGIGGLGAIAIIRRRS